MTAGEWLEPGPLALAAGAVAASAWVATLVWARWRRGERLVAWRPHDPVPWTGADVATVLLAYLLAAGLGQELVGEPASIVRRLAVNSGALAAAVAFGVAALRARGATWDAVGFRGRWPDDFRLAAAALGLLVAPLLGLAGLLDRLVPYRHPLVDLLAERRDPIALAVVIGSAVVAAPVAEEFFFRRVLQGWLERRLPDGGWTAVVLSATVFALAHQGQGLAYVPLFPFGLVLGAIARQTGSIAACILVHALFNAISVGILLAT
ncbi:CPBP family intramembrane metalloprotease [bacterium]|nr:CPBP family intramembrane metalloprotease [bacterium]